MVEDVRAFLESLRRDLPEVFRREARTGDASGFFSERVAHWSGRMELKPGRLRVKGMSSLWGSCSPKGDMCLNEGLSKAPIEVLDYVVVHELAHLKWRGHGRRFWDLVERFCPEHRRHRRWLRKNGQELLPA